MSLDSPSHSYIPTNTTGSPRPPEGARPDVTSTGARSVLFEHEADLLDTGKTTYTLPIY